MIEMDKKAQSFDKIVREVFAPIYPILASQILEKTKKENGHCLDIGCGTGALGRAVAQLSTLHISFFDQSQEMLKYAMKYAINEDLLARSDFVLGDVHKLPFEDKTMELIISRGSSPFWSDWDQAYQEIYRVLKPNGHAYIGGGFGNKELREKIVKTMNERNKKWNKPFKEKVLCEREKLTDILHKLPASQSHIINDESGFWVHIIK